MELKRSKEWWLSKADAEGDVVVAAGALARDPAPELESSSISRLAFGRFVNLMRRRLSLSVEAFAERAALDVSEVLSIEDDLSYTARPRTIYQLSQTLNVPQERLLVLAGLAGANDTGLGEEAVRFAARSESVERLSKEEQAALEAFIAVLSQAGSNEAREESDP